MMIQLSQNAQHNSASALVQHEPSVDNFRLEAISVVLHIPPMNLHSMRTRSKSGIDALKYPVMHIPV